MEGQRDGKMDRWMDGRTDPPPTPRKHSVLPRRRLHSGELGPPAETRVLSVWSTACERRCNKVPRANDFGEV